MRIIFAKHYFIISIFSILSCNNSNPELLQLVSAEGVVKPLEDIIIRCPMPRGILSAEGKVLIFNRCGDYPLQIIDLANKKEHWIGRFGDGPNEMRSPTNMLSYAKEPGVLVKVLDSRTQSIFRVMAKDDEYYLEEERKIPPMIYGYKNFIELQDQSIIYNRLQDEYNIGKWLPTGEELFVIDFQPDIGSPKGNTEKAMHYYNHIVVNPINGKIIQILAVFPYMLAYDHQLQLIEIKQTRDNIPKPDWSIDGSDKFADIPINARDILPGANYFYVLNPRATPRERSTGNFPPSIDIYNWNMELVASLSLDKFFDNFAIDFENKKIYGSTFGTEDQVLGEVSIPVSLHPFF